MDERKKKERKKAVNKSKISFYPDSSSSLEEVDSEIPDAMEKKMIKQTYRE